MYRSKNGMSHDQIKALAYVMTKEFGGRQSDAAQFFGVSGGTISGWVKDAGYMVRIGALEREVTQARQQLETYRRLPPPDDFWINSDDE
ncbi:hypothetical protein AGMMS50225_06650 [Betaproteobacteria bacterium]|nr:hypothetical protein AGMMS50225_06650 [Betaproteobacteria bacterium]